MIKYNRKTFEPKRHHANILTKNVCTSGVHIVSNIFIYEITQVFPVSFLMS